MAKRIRISNETLNCFGTWVKTDGVDLEQFPEKSRHAVDALEGYHYRKY